MLTKEEFETELAQEIQNITDNDKYEIAKNMNYSEKELTIGKYTFTYVESGVDVEDSNVYQYVYKNNETGYNVLWSAPYSSWDNGGPDGSIESWSLEYFAAVEKVDKVIQVWA